MTRTMKFRPVLALLLSEACLVFAQQQADIAPIRPGGNIATRPYRPAEVPPVQLKNSGRLAGLIRAGKLYLTAQDAIALALENNIDIEVARYGQSTLEWNLERAQAGGALPGVPSGASVASSNASGQGVLGSQAAAGVSSGGASNSRTTANATVAQVGPVTANLDPSIQESDIFSHRTVPQPDVVQSIVPVLIQGQRIYSASYQQGFLLGGAINVSFNDHYLNENAPTDVLNPSSAQTLSFSFQQNLLQGFGRAVNERTITVAKMNLAMSDQNFRAQVSSTVSQVLDVYYTLAADYDDVKAKNDAIDAARKALESGQKELELGVIAPLDVTSEQSQIASTVETYVNSLAGLQQKEVELKNLISRTGLADPLLSGVSIVPLDHIVIPATDDIPPVKDLVAKAMANRPDLKVEDQNVKAAEVSAKGTVNGLLPTAQVFATQSEAGLAGAPRVAYNGEVADRYFVGGAGTAFAQIARRNFPSENVGVFGALQIHDRVAEADYAIDQLQLRQQQLTVAKDRNQAQLDITNAVVALRQSRARYEAAAQNAILERQLYEAEQRKQQLGSSTSLLVILQSRDLVLAQATELSAEASWESARLNLDQVTGSTLETNHVSFAEARDGRVSGTSRLPAQLPQ
jgi:outer membrane protein